jgi:hypothetical protein
MGRFRRDYLGWPNRRCFGRFEQHYLGGFHRRCLDRFDRHCLGGFHHQHYLGRFDRHRLGWRLLASERHPLLDYRAARALPCMMLVTGHRHRGVLGHLNQAHLCAALPAQHWQQPAEPALKEKPRYSVLAGLSLGQP